jgi:glycosyltransferase involved in cell wall biosynthesis
MTSVSVALCTYNGERYLPELLESLVTQERLPSEVVVCDDGSTDRTVDLLRSFADTAPFPVRIDVNERNLGTTKNFELAMSRCDADLIALCDQDDIWMPKKLLRAVEAFDQTPELGYTFSDAELMDELSQPTHKRLWDSVGFFEARRQAAVEGRLIPLLAVYTFVTGATMTFRSDLRSFVLPIPHGWIHDAWIALLAAFVRPYRMLDEPLLRYRIHEEQKIGVPATVMPDDTGWSKWKVRFAEAPQKVNLRMADLHKQRRRTQSMQYDEAVDRIATQSAPYVAAHGGAMQPLAAEGLQDLRDRARHLRVRGFLPDSRFRRVAVIGKELRSGRYGRYSAGVLSALQDFVS